MKRLAADKSEIPADDLRLLREFFLREKNGTLNGVPVFGTGLNIQAAITAGYPQKDDWRELLAKIGQRTLPKGETVESLPRTHLSLWEALLCRWAIAERVYPFQAENALLQFVCEELRRQEVECESFPLYQAVASAGFRDIVSLNFDRRIANGVAKRTFVTGLSPCPLGSHGESLFRHHLVSHADGKSTRVWYPHGDVKKAATLKFGVRKYGFYIAVLREYLQNEDGRWRYRTNRNVVLPDAETKERAIKGQPSWVTAILERPLMFIGCGITPQEWVWWWLLQRRHRSGMPPALFLTFGEKPPAHLKARPEVKVILFPTPEKLWELVMMSISRNEAGHA